MADEPVLDPATMPAGPGSPSSVAAPQAMPQPATQAQPAEGAHRMAAVHVQMAMQLLKAAMPAFDLGSREGKAVLSVLKNLAVTFGAAPESQVLVPSQVLEMVKAVQQNGAAPLSQQVQ